MSAVPLGEVADFINGVAFKPDDWGDKGTKIIRIQNLNDKNKPYNRTTRSVDKKYIVQTGDILVSWSASLGVFEWSDEPALLNQHIFRVVPHSSKTDKAYLKYALVKALDDMQHHLHGATMQHVNRGEFLGTQIYLPSLTEQKRIAGVLDKADGIRRKHSESLSLLDELLRATFLDMFGDPIINPKNWPEKELIELATVNSGVTKGRNLSGKKIISIPYMRVANVQDGFLNLDEIKQIDIAEHELEKFSLEFGDILLTEGGDPDKLGRGYVWHNEISPCVHQNHIFKVRIKTPKITPYFLSTLIGSSRGKSYFLKAAKQTTGIATINKTQLSAFPILVPDKKLQEAFETIHKKVCEAKTRIVSISKESDALFHSLVARAFQGEL
jgi:type I restriction enzyme S subunit